MKGDFRHEAEQFRDLDDAALRRIQDLEANPPDYIRGLRDATESARGRHHFMNAANRRARISEAVAAIEKLILKAEKAHLRGDRL